MEVIDLQVDEKIKKILKDHYKLNMKGLAEQIGFTQTGLKKALDKETLKLTDFLKICAVLKTSILHFLPEFVELDEEGNLLVTVEADTGNTELTKEQKGEIEELKGKLIEKQEDLIGLLKELNTVQSENQELKNKLLQLQ